MDRFRIDLNNLPKMWSRPRKPNDDYLKLVQLHKSRAKGPKNHSVNRERSLADRLKAKRIKRELEEKRKVHQAYKVASWAYWTGERDTHP